MITSLQQEAKHPETFTPHVISLKPEVYKSMVVALNLPYRAIESTSVVGPFFWAAWDQDEEFPHLRNLIRHKLQWRVLTDFRNCLSEERCS
jgi:hypothetical protein